MERFACPYLQGEVELTDERRRHIESGHPDLEPRLLEAISEVLGKPDEVRRDTRYAETRLISRYFSDFHGGKHIIVAVVTDPPLAADQPPRH